MTHTGCIGKNCPICPKLKSPKYAAVRANLAISTPTIDKLACVHRGSETRETTCTACNGRVPLTVFACSVHGECTVDKLADKERVACCRVCNERQAPASQDNAILLTGGIGDVLTIEAMLPPERRDTLETIYYACPAVNEIRQLFPALPNYPRLKNHIVLPTGATTHYEKATVEKRHGNVPAVDCSILTMFPRGLPHIGSSFLSHKVARRQTLAKDYVVIVDRSTWGKDPGRDFDAMDWAACTRWLDREGMHGIVLSRDAITIPSHPRLTAMQLPILDAIEMVKGAAGYIGIDSWVSVLAAKLFPAGRLFVKAIRGHLYDWKHVYYAPRTKFDFIGRSLSSLRI